MPNTITGTLGNDTLTGTAADDLIDALGGNDSVTGGLGSDTILGGDGLDTLYGGVGNDFLDGGADADALYGEQGNDTLSGGAGNDSLYGSSGANTLFGGDGDDLLDNTGDALSLSGLLDGGVGNDTLIADFIVNSNDTLIGGDGNDVILNVGSNSADIVDAGAGNDIVSVNGYTDSTYGISTITLGTGQDTLTFYNGAVSPFRLGSQFGTITDFATGAGGDKVDLVPILYVLTGYPGTNPFGTGHLRLTQSGADTLLQVDPDGAANGAAFTTLFRFQNTTATSFTSANFTPAWPTNGSTPPGQSIAGTPGNDTLAGTLGADTIDGLGGNDSITGDAGPDTILGGAGLDTLSGGLGNDFLDGGAGADVLYGDQGDDTLSGGDGNDLLYGGAGRNTLSGGDGDDVLGDIDYRGGLLDGGAGNDTLHGSFNSADTLVGGDGNDLIDSVGVWAAADSVDAGAGDDIVRLSNGNDPAFGVISTITLGAGQDTLTFDYTLESFAIGGQQATITDFATGAGGDKVDLAPILDALTDYTGANPFGTGFLRLTQSGADTLLQVDADGAANGAIFTTLFRFQNTSAVAFTATNFTPAWPTDGSTPSGQIITGTPGTDTLTGTLGDDVIDALGGNDSITGDGGSDTLLGGEGIDTIFGGVGNDAIDGGADADLLIGDQGDDTLSGGAGNDSLDGGTGFNTLLGGDGNDFLTNNTGQGGLQDGGSGNDTLYASNNTVGAIDTLIGGDGNDVFYFVGDYSADIVDAGAGNDIVRLSGYTDPAYIVSSTITLGTGQDTLAFDGLSQYTLIFASQFATITDFATGVGGDKVDLLPILNGLTNYDGSNPFTSGFLRLTQSGADTLLQVGANGIANSAPFITLLRFQNTTAASFTVNNFSPIIGTEGADSLTGDESNDLIFGLGGDDTLYSAGGDDTVDGGSGDDIIIAGSGAGNDVYDGGTGIDTLVLSSAKSDLDVRFDFGTSVGTDTGFDLISNFENVVGGDGNDMLVGNGFANNMQAGAGNDTVQGGVGNDRLFGNGGDDRLDGGADNDILTGGAGNDTLVGGAGFDVFAFGPTFGFGSDTVLDFVTTSANAGVHDVIDLSGLGQAFASLGIVYVAGNASITLTGGNLGDQITLSGVGGGLQAADFYFSAAATFSGSSGNDTINALSGTLSGFAGGSVQNLQDNVGDAYAGLGGADTIIAGIGDDSLDGGAGIDLLVGRIGNDIYIVDTYLDQVVENANEGIDTVVSTSSYIMAANVENLTLAMGAGLIDGLGNDLDNVITGNDFRNGVTGGLGNDTIYGNGGDDAIDGGVGADLMVGGPGVDTYYVDNVGDQVVETEVGPGKYDTVWTSLTTFTLPTNVEIYIAISGAGNVSGVGNDDVTLMLGNEGNNNLSSLGGNDIILGRDGNDTINGGTDGGQANSFDIISGGAGADLLTGGGGHDYFNYESISHGGDTITDFKTNAGQDDDILDFRPMFPTFTNINGITTVAQAVASGHLTYTQAGTATQVFADADGTAGPGASVLLATLLNTNAASVQIYTLI